MDSSRLIKAVSGIFGKGLKYVDLSGRGGMTFSLTTGYGSGIPSEITVKSPR